MKLIPKDQILISWGWTETKGYLFLSRHSDHGYRCWEKIPLHDVPDDVQNLLSHTNWEMVRHTTAE